MNSQFKSASLGARTIILPAGVTNITRFAPIAGAISCLITNIGGVTAMILDSPTPLGATITPEAGITLLAEGKAYAISEGKTISSFGVPEIFFCAGSTAVLNILFSETVNA